MLYAVTYSLCSAAEVRQEVVVEEADLDEDVSVTSDNTDVLNTLTGIPVEEDTLLYTVPFCAPYSVLQNFKWANAHKYVILIDMNMYYTKL